MEDLRAEIERLERKHQEAPDGRYLVPLATLYRRAGELDAAETLLREALKRRPENLSAHIVLGGCLMDRGQWEEAAAEFRQVLALDPQNLIALRSLGELARRRGDWVEARRWYEELLAVDPMNEDAQAALQELRAAAEPPPAPAAGAPEPAPQGREPAPEAEPHPTLDLVRDDDRLMAWDPHAVHLDEPAEEAVFAPPEEESELLTETMAELYVQQGHVDKAIGVYRELLRGRNDPVLRQRLAELEAEQAHGQQKPGPTSLEVPLLDLDAFGAVRGEGGAASPPEERPVSGEAASAGGPADASAAGEVDTFADSFVYGFGDAPVPVGEGVRAAEEPVGAAAPEARPEAAPAVEAPAAPALSAAARMDTDAGAAEAGIRRTVRTWLRRWLGAPSEVGAAAGAPEAAGSDTAAVAAPTEEASAAATEPTPAPADEPEPWELTPEPGAAPSAPAPESEGPGFSFSAMLREPTRIPAADVPPPAEPPRAETADDDLEAFQAWLRSLKR